ncbi:multidrug resistance protein, MATE family [Serratia symbiotica str. 'Cinara cedri']|nr:multidrug resistance protein, MATE family [Serratia symbiotica str. 'Cinara cedri']
MQKYFIEVRNLLLLAIPVIIAQISQTAMGVVDTIMAGSYSATDMAAVAIGTSIWLPLILFGHGLLLSLTPVIAHLNGSGRRYEIAHQVQQGFWLASGASLLLIILLYNCKWVINIMGDVDPQLASKSLSYLHAIMWGTPGYLFFQVICNQCEGLSKTKPSMIIGLIGLLINIPINYIFIYGKLGIPQLGGVGCGVATSSVYWLMFLMIHLYVKRAPSQQDIKLLRNIHPRLDLIALKYLISIGLPIALALFFEITLFAVVSVLVTPLGIIAVAGHQIALNFSSLMFVLPLSLGVGASIRVGYRLGEGSIDGARIATYTTIIIGIIIATCTGLLTMIFRKEIALLYNSNPAVIGMASQLMLLAAIYQISDAVQVIGSGILRGYKDTRVIFFITFIAYWVLGLPCGYLLALTDILVPALGPSGFWIGFIIGLTVAAIMIIFRIRWLHQQPAILILQR